MGGGAAGVNLQHPEVRKIMDWLKYACGDEADGSTKCTACLVIARAVDLMCSHHAEMVAVSGKR